ncbi:unnamed protein product [Durusdinium trenchii]|uniref:Uncharacterized protein n=1 Tax=Durusdinium trenchii TaxID=1381693 RepID=A0ABP0JLP1_9DINO
MKLTYLEAFHTHGEECDQSKYAANGMDDARLKALIKSPPCDCGCVVPLSTLRRVCRTFWSMEKANQDAVLWSLLSAETDDKNADFDSDDELLRLLIDRHLMGATREILLEERDLSKLPVRELPPNTYSGLYMMYVAWARNGNQPPSSRSTFYTVAQKWTSLVPNDVTLKNCYKVRKHDEHDASKVQTPVPHCFTFMKRSRMPVQFEKVERLPTHLRSHDDQVAMDDVFCLVKSELSSSSLSQVPILVLPGSLLGKSKRFLELAKSSDLLAKPVFEPERKDEIKRLAVALKRDFPSLRRGINWYETLLARSEDTDVGQATHLSFLNNINNVEELNHHDFQWAARPALDTYVPALNTFSRKAHLQLIPDVTMDEFWLPLKCFDISKDAKNGCPVVQSLDEFQFSIHFPEFLKQGYLCSMESIQCKFPHRDGSRTVEDHSVGFTDGQTKVLIMIAIVLFCKELEFGEKEMQNLQLRHVLKSFESVRCRIGYVTAEKMSPSPLSMAGDMEQAVAIERRLSRPGVKTALRDVLGRCIADYNRMTAHRRHKIDSARVSHEVLQADFPGCKSRLEVDAFRGKDVFAEILETTAETANLYFQRKSSQLDLPAHEALHDIACLWQWVRAKMEREFPADVISHHDALWHLDADLHSVMRMADGKVAEGESTVMPASRAWVRNMATDMGNTSDDHSIFIFVNYPSLGIAGAAKNGFLLNYVTNILRPDAKRKAEKDEDDEEEKLFGKAQPESDNEAPGEDDKKEESGESALLREASPQTKSATLPHLGRAMTDIQELRQVAGGTPFVRSTMDAFKIPTSKANILIDATGYDGWVARACVEEITEGNSCVCGTVCLDHSGQSLLNGVAQAVYQGCRGSSLQVPGFPHFEPILAALKQGRAAAANTSFQVTVQQADRLLILESLATKWLSSEQTKDRAEEIVKDHNGRFNPDGSLMGDRRTKDQTHLCSCSLQSCVKINPSTS